LTVPLWRWWLQQRRWHGRRDCSSNGLALEPLVHLPDDRLPVGALEELELAMQISK
jgi:hypothetical protein